MYIDFTSKQYSFILHALAIMITFYSNDFSSICKEVGEACQQPRLNRFAGYRRGLRGIP